MRKALLASVLLAATSAQAADFGLNLGVLEVILLPPAHGGFYVYAGGSVAVPIGKGFTFVGSVSIEWSFDQMRGGFVVVSSLDYVVHEHVGLDVNLVFIEDQPGLRFNEAQLFLGGGPGASFFVGKWTFSVFFSVLGGLNVPGVSLVPGVNVAYTL
ncbi:MAG: hypothetical protein IT380_06340 [Myxococcales bacterium]|nr:hypothetical protein [Myxococcales bacterium]